MVLHFNYYNALYVPCQLQEHFNITKNNVENLGGDLVNLSALRTLNCRHNRLIDEGIPKDIFNLEDLQVVVHSIYLMQYLYMYFVLLHVRMQIIIELW